MYFDFKNDSEKKLLLENKLLKNRFFIDSKKKNIYSDIRVLVSNHKIVSSMERVSDNFITNVFKGARCKKKEITTELKALIIKISKIFDLGYAGIDVKLDEKKIAILGSTGSIGRSLINIIEKKKNFLFVLIFSVFYLFLFNIYSKSTDRVRIF